jgi:tetratricopeptide (TPR) repeat protein
MMVYPKPSTTPGGSGNRVSALSTFGELTEGYSQQMARREAALRAFASGHHQRQFHEMGSPILNAKASLDMLSTLCEQSGWKWVEGMLLGGCLHYGLERYEEALEWFKRIVNLDQM